MLRNADPRREATHRLVVDADVADPKTGVVAENRVVDVATDADGAVHLLVDEDDLERFVPEKLRTLHASLRTAPDRRFEDRSYPEYVADSADAYDALRTVLAVDGPGSGRGGWRQWGVHAIAVFDADGDWRYCSVPHHAQVRHLRIGPGTLSVDQYRDALADLPGACLFPRGPLVSWTDGDLTYELEPDGLAVELADGNRSVLGLARLRRIAVRRRRCEVVFDWETRAERAESGLTRVAWRLVDAVTGDEPSRVRLPDERALDEFLASLEDVRTGIGYSFEIVE